MNVLLIEPDTILANAYVATFAAQDVQVRHAASAQRAIEAVDAHMPDVVVLELQLAGHSGIEFLHELRSYEDWAAIPIVVHSAVPQAAFGVDDSTWRRLGVVRYLYKADTSVASMVAITIAIGEKGLV